MKDFGKALEFVVLVALGLGLAFLFDGEPDVWSVLHDKAMQTSPCIKENTL